MRTASSSLRRKRKRKSLPATRDILPRSKISARGRRSPSKTRRVRIERDACSVRSNPGINDDSLPVATCDKAIWAHARSCQDSAGQNVRLAFEGKTIGKMWHRYDGKGARGGYSGSESGSDGSCIGVGGSRGKKSARDTALWRKMLLLGLFWGQWKWCDGEALAGGQKYSTRTVRTRYGSLRGLEARSSTAVETYYGVPYASPPLGALRYMPPVTPTPWRGTRLADTMPPACPQSPPHSDLATLPKSKRAYLARLAPILANQSEDCLYLNLYVPKTPHGTSPDALPALLLIHGDSYSWGTGNSFDGTSLAAHGRLIVVSINFRLGILGFLKTGPKTSMQGNYGLMDLIAGLHWLHENLGAFGGNPERLALLGHGTGAALANFLAVSPMAKELIKRVILLGGSALSPWAIQRDPLTVKRRVADQTGCHGDVENEDIAACLRSRSVEELLRVELDSPRFTSGFAPFVDGTVLPVASNQNFQPTASSSGLIPLVPGPGAEFANFGNRDLLLGLTSEEAWVNLTEEDLQNGLNETRRDRILRTYVRNTYRYHLHEIYSTLRNEYTDWERGEQSPLAICEGLLSLLGDGQVAAPLLRLALLHASAEGRGYFVHFQPGERPSHKGEELPYFLGIPLMRTEFVSSSHSGHYGYSGRGTANYTVANRNLSKLLLHYLANFVRRGDPNGASSLTSGIDGLPSSPPFWDLYDSINQLYLEAGANTEMRSHYRGHKMSLWLNLLPQLHRPGYEISMRHHHLAESPALYEGAVRPQTMAVPLAAPPLPLPLPIPSPTEPSSVSSMGQAEVSGASVDVSVGVGVDVGVGVGVDVASAGGIGVGVGVGVGIGVGVGVQVGVGVGVGSLPTTECTPNATVATTLASTPRNFHQSNHGSAPNNLLRKLASSHYQNYTTALTVTIAVGVFLLLLNIIIFAGIYHQRDRNSPTGSMAATGGIGGGAGCPSIGGGTARRVATGTVTTGRGLLSSAFLGEKKKKKEKEELLEAGCSGIEPHSGKQRLSTLNLMGPTNGNPPPPLPPSSSSSSSHKTKLVQELEMQLQQFQCSPPPAGGKRITAANMEPPLYTRSPCLQRTRTPSPCIDATTARIDEDIGYLRGPSLDSDDERDEDEDDDDDDEDDDDEDDDDGNEDDDDNDEDNLPEPPPPPKVPAPNVTTLSGPGILRQPGTPGSTKKRVQIQEISV